LLHEEEEADELGARVLKAELEALQECNLNKDVEPQPQQLVQCLNGPTETGMEAADTCNKVNITTKEY
jgi:hypothetical protein